MIKLAALFYVLATPFNYSEDSNYLRCVGAGVCLTLYPVYNVLTLDEDYLHLSTPFMLKFKVK